MKMKLVPAIFCFALISSAAPVWAQDESPASNANTLFQVSTLYALENGVFNGDYPYSALMQRGTLGVGTFNDIDGEMVAVDGQYYQSTPDCHLKKVSPDLIAPFAEVIAFQPTQKFSLDNVKNYDSLDRVLLKRFSNPNMPYAIRIDGTFTAVTVRSLTKQKQPYPDLLTASKKQGVLQLNKVKGTAVGFWFPHYWEGVGMPKVHLHFATEDRQLGGHVLALQIDQAQVQLQPVQNIQVYLPNTATFKNSNLEHVDELTEQLKKQERKD